MAKVLKTIFLALLFILGITVSMENTGWVVLRYYFGLETPPLPLFLLLLFSILLGICLAGVGFLFDERSLRRSVREKEQRIAALEEELRSYRQPEPARLRAEG